MGGAVVSIGHENFITLACVGSPSGVGVFSHGSISKRKR